MFIVLLNVCQQWHGLEEYPKMLPSRSWCVAHRSSIICMFPPQGSRVLFWFDHDNKFRYKFVGITSSCDLDIGLSMLQWHARLRGPQVFWPLMKYVHKTHVHSGCTCALKIQEDHQDALFTPRRLVSQRTLSCTHVRSHVLHERCFRSVPNTYVLWNYDPMEWQDHTRAQV